MKLSIDLKGFEAHVIIDSKVCNNIEKEDMQDLVMTITESIVTFAEGKLDKKYKGIKDANDVSDLFN